MPIAYIARTRKRYSRFAPYKWVVNTDAPWTPLAKPLAASDRKSTRLNSSHRL